MERSSNGIRGIARIFKAMDDNKNHKLDVDDFRWGVNWGRSFLNISIFVNKYGTPNSQNWDNHSFTIDKLSLSTVNYSLQTVNYS